MVSDISNICVVKTDSGQPGDNMIIYFLVQAYSTKELRGFINYVFTTNPDAIFGVIVDVKENSADEAEKKEWAGMICTLLAHPGYYKVNERSLVGFLKDSSVNTSIESRKYLLDALELQRFDSVILEIIDVNAAGAQGNGVIFINQEALKSEESFYKNYILELTVSETPLSLFIFDNADAIKRLVSLKRAAEEKLFHDEEHLARVISLYHKATANLSRVQQEKLLLEEDLRSKSDYLKFLLKKSMEANESGGLEFSDLMKIKRFYHYEYEILPLWYKRIGHVLKVIMGKRTFKSLFDDNAKKYTD